MTFHIGQKVVCIAEDYQDDAPPPYPSIGTIATVIWLGMSRDGNDFLIDLLEFPSPETTDYDRGYYAKDWRPIVERKTDISVFTEILRKATKPAPALAQSQHQRGSENV